MKPGNSGKASAPEGTPEDTNKIIEERRAKLAALRNHGNPFPNDFRRHHFAGDLQREYGEKTKEELEATPISVVVAGRMLLKRVMGKASFATLQDMSGRIQIYVTNDATGEAEHAAFKHWDLGRYARFPRNSMVWLIRNSVTGSATSISLSRRNRDALFRFDPTPSRRCAVFWSNAATSRWKRR
jgi:lysyl-tRNA synthetase class II